MACLRLCDSYSSAAACLLAYAIYTPLLPFLLPSYSTAVLVAPKATAYNASSAGELHPRSYALGKTHCRLFFFSRAACWGRISDTKWMRTVARLERISCRLPFSTSFVYPILGLRYLMHPILIQSVRLHFLLMMIK